MICDGVLGDGCLWKNGLHRVTNSSWCFADNPKFLIADGGDDDNVKAGLAPRSYSTYDTVPSSCWDVRGMLFLPDYGFML